MRMTANIFSNHRLVPPFGLNGGEAGLVRHNWIERQNGDREILAQSTTVEMKPVDVFVIETPGGGGFG